MKRIVLVMALWSLVCLSKEAQAQHNWSAGYRTGLSQTDWNLDEHDFDGQNIRWNNQLFLTRSLGKRFEMELTLNHHTINTFDSLIYFDGNTTSTTQQQKVNVITAGLSGKYYLIQKKGLGIYAQLGITALKSFGEYNSVVYTTGQPTKYYSGKENSPVSMLNTIFTGIGINYSLTRSIYLNANVQLSYKADGINNGAIRWYSGNNNYNDWATGIYIGAAYRF